MDIIEIPGPPVFYVIFKALFSRAEKVSINGKTYPIRRFGGEQGNLPGVDYGNTRIVIQNPNTDSKWAKMAREGKQIAWAINLGRGRPKWNGRIVNGRCYKNTDNGWKEVTWKRHKEAPK